MKVSAAVVFSVAITTSMTNTNAFIATPMTRAFIVHPPNCCFGSLRTTLLTATASTPTTPTTTTTTVVEEEQRERPLTKREERLKMMQSDQFHRKGFKEVRKAVEETMAQQYQSAVVQELKASSSASTHYNKVNEDAGVSVYLAKDFGFCWGVERSIALAYEAVEHFSLSSTNSDASNKQHKNRQIHITNELIHNPEVNDRLTEMNVRLLEKTPPTTSTAASSSTLKNKNSIQKNWEQVQDGDVVILPAFGASLEEMNLLHKKNVEIVDTTCPWVSKVWNTVDKHQKQGLTSVIHGKYSHEETVATTSFCEDYICVKDLKEAQMVADYILQHTGNDDDDSQNSDPDAKAAFLHYFRNAISPGFDPDTMLRKIGLANQTTMYKKETRAIGQLLQKTMLKKYGPVDTKKHYMEFDTICDATQERQDAISELVEHFDEYKLDFILVIGGWDSSNTAHLLEIPILAGRRAFHINKADCIGADNTITHRTVHGDIVTEPFLLGNLSQNQHVVLGVTSGASTPDAAIQDALSNIFLLRKTYRNKPTVISASAERETATSQTRDDIN